MKQSPNFRRLLTSIGNSELLVPMLRSALYDPTFDSFDVTVEGFKARPPNGWFWPSTHPLLPERVLYQYVTSPQTLLTEPMDPTGTLAVTAGSFFHTLVQSVLVKEKVLVKQPEVCGCGARHPERAETFLVDEEAGTRGHSDGVVYEGSGFEYKCLAPETPVSTPSGPRRADELRSGDSVIAWDPESDRLVVSTLASVEDNGIQPVWTVTTREGRKIGVTDEHPFLTPDGWVEAQHLLPGDRVKVASDYTPDVDDLPGPIWAWFLGLMVGDGGLTGNDVRLSTADVGIENRVRTIAGHHGCSLTHVGGCDYRIAQASGVKTRNPIKDGLRLDGLWGLGSREKRVPGSIWMGGPVEWAAFLSGYFDADGTVVTKGSYAHALWTSVNRPLLEDCQTLLSYLGIRSSVVEIASTYLGEPHRSWRLMVRDGVSVSRLMDTLDLTSAKRAALAGLEPKIPNGGHHLTATPGWDIVRSVEEGLARPTVALEVEGTHTHVTAGLVTHNTMNPMKLGRMPRGVPESHEVLDWFKTKCPAYYAQAQEYLRMSGRSRMIVVITELTYPFTMREIHVRFDRAYAFATRDKYLRVRDAAEKTDPPRCECGPTTKTCPSRGACWK